MQYNPIRINAQGRRCRRRRGTGSRGRRRRRTVWTMPREASLMSPRNASPSLPRSVPLLPFASLGVLLCCVVDGSLLSSAPFSYCSSKQYNTIQRNTIQYNAIKHKQSCIHTIFVSESYETAFKTIDSYSKCPSHALAGPPLCIALLSRLICMRLFLHTLTHRHCDVDAG